MSKLNLVTPTPQLNANILLYGPPGSGKSTAAASAPKPLLYLNGDSPNATRFAHGLEAGKGEDFDEVHVDGLDTLASVIHATKDKTKYKTVVLDTVGDAYRRVLEGISGKALHPQIQMYGDTGTHIERFCRAMVELPVNFIVTAQENKIKDEETGVLDRMPFTGTNNPALAGKLMAVVDVVGYTAVLSEDGKEPRYVAGLIDSGGHRGKDRFGALGQMRDLDLGEWIGTAIKPVESKTLEGAAA